MHAVDDEQGVHRKQSFKNMMSQVDEMAQSIVVPFQTLASQTAGQNTTTPRAKSGARAQTQAAANPANASTANESTEQSTKAEPKVRTDPDGYPKNRQSRPGPEPGAPGRWMI